MTARIEQTGLVQHDEAAARSARVRSEAYAERYRAPFSLRCGALLIDYILIVIVVAISTLWARLLGGGARLAGGTTETIGLLAALIVAALNFLGLASLRGQTLGKWATGLRIERADGSSVGTARILLRHVIGYPLSLLLFGFGFLFAAFDPQGRTLHDLLAGTRVLRSQVRRVRRNVGTGAGSRRAG